MKHKVEKAKKPEVQYCKKCKCELPSDNPGDLCSNCRKKDSDRLVKGVIGSLAMVAAVGKFRDKIPDLIKLLESAKNIRF